VRRCPIRIMGKTRNTPYRPCCGGRPMDAWLATKMPTMQSVFGLIPPCAELLVAGREVRSWRFMAVTAHTERKPTRHVVPEAKGAGFTSWSWAVGVVRPDRGRSRLTGVVRLGTIMDWMSDKWNIASVTCMRCADRVVASRDTSRRARPWKRMLAAAAGQATGSAAGVAV